jgi:hypothetical protein
MIDLDQLELRQLQLESARVLSIMHATNSNISKFNKQACHDSHSWYKAVIQWYIDEYGNLPSRTGPGKDIQLVHNV